VGDLSASVRLKLDRADEHANTMRSLIKAWEKQPQPYRFVTEVDEDADRLDALYGHLRYLIRIFRALPADGLSKALGDCINNYRCVLDHLIWELSIQHSGDPPPNPTGIKFPGEWSGKQPPGLHAVHPDVAAEVKWLHDNIAGHDPSAPPFWMLIQLSNVDKHRSIHAVYHATKSVDFRVIDPIIIGTRIDVLDPPEFEDGAIILARVALPRSAWRREEVTMKGRTEHGIAIARTAKTPFGQLGMTVDGIEHAVKEAAERLRHHLA
jgi:hypothetical protein